MPEPQGKITVSDEVAILAFEALQLRNDPVGWLLEFTQFQADWQAFRLEQQGSRQLSFWRGPGPEAMVLLTEGRPAERRLTALDFAPWTRAASVTPMRGSWQRPGRCLSQDDQLFEYFGIFVGWWPCEPGATGLRLTRAGAATEIAAGPDGFILVDWTDPAPVERFDAVEITGRGFVPTALPVLPLTSEQLLESYRGLLAAGHDLDRNHPDAWSYDVFGLEILGLDAQVALMRVADAERDAKLLLQFGALIYGNNSYYYDRIECEFAAGTIAPEVLNIVLAMEKPEFMTEELRLRHWKLAARCARY